jgi:23S rRNA (adenine1618-N6)-methyltransferase
MKNRPTLHPRNRHQGRYDFAQLTRALPELLSFVIENPQGDSSVDFSNPAAVKALNRAILKQFYGIEHWDVPEGYLCPPIPGRADYIHSAADLIESTGPSVRVLDIGVGANCVYPIIGQSEYGWSFVGSDVDERALASAKLIVDANPALKGHVELRHQKNSTQVFRGIIKPGEKFALSICNPPFHASLEDAQEGSRRKWNNLGKASPQGKPPVKNFGGQASELWCPGGEAEFIRRMIVESAEFSTQCRWFSTLVSQVDNLKSIYGELQKAGVADYREQMMSQGQKISRIVAWTF